MVGHLNVPALEEGIPSSLSKKIIEEILIKRNNYKGFDYYRCFKHGGRF